MADRINVLVRGQSNALLFADRGGDDALAAALEQQLGVPVNIIAEFGTDSSTIHSATRFMDWDTGGEQQSMLQHLRELPADVRAAPTITVWMHNEYDQQTNGLTSDQWVAEVKADAALVREVLGQEAATTPYLFVPVRYPYGGNFDAIGDGMAQLAADPSFNALVTYRATEADIRMDGDGFANSSHIGNGDALTIGNALDDVLVATLRPLVDGSMPAPAPVPGPVVTPPSPPVDGGSDGFTTVLSDDFSEGYKTENWGQPFDGGVYWNGAWSWSGADVAVRDDEMQVTMTQHADGWWTGGGFNSFKAGVDITYGRVEFDARMEEAQGTMAAILMWPTSDQWPRDGEIDILETPGNDVMHTLHWEGDGGADWYDAIRNQSYDPAEWNHYEMTWLPDRLTIEVNDRVVAEWTENIPDGAMGFGAMGFVASSNDQWVGGAPDGSTPDVVTLHLDNVVMSQWDGGAVPPSGPPAGPPPVVPPVVTPPVVTPPAGNPPPVVTPPAPGVPGAAVMVDGMWGEQTIQAQAGAEVFDYGLGDGIDVIRGFEVGVDAIRAEDGMEYETWAHETTHNGEAGTMVQWSWWGAEKVFLAGVSGADMDTLANPVGAPVVMPLVVVPPVVMPPVVVPPEPTEPGPTMGEVINGGRGREELLGTSGDDTIDGGAGGDTIEGGAGKDILTGGTGQDVFVFGPGDTGLGEMADVITDFGKKDVMDLTAFGPNAWWSVKEVGADDVVEIWVGEEVVAEVLALSHYKWDAEDFILA